jgi:hypothetical protein
LKNLDAILDLLSTDERVRKLISREVRIPAYIDDFNPVDEYWYPHPPCLVPLFLGHVASYKGAVKHFFCDREISYVEYFSEQGYMNEIARNANQLITWMVLRMIITKDELTAEIVEFCDLLNYKDAEAVDEFSVEYGDEPDDYEHLPYFGENRPFKYLRKLSDYGGDFGSSIHILNTPEKLRRATIHEIVPAEKATELIDLPSWLVEDGDKKAEFTTYMEKGMFKEAWFTLNTKNWAPKDIAIALKKLVEKSGDYGLKVIAEAWIERWQNSPIQ